MRSMATHSLVILVWAYALFVVGWYLLNRRFGDGFWWLALLNPFGALFFVPLPLFGLALLAWPSASLAGALLAPLLLFGWLYGPLLGPNRRRPDPASAPVDEPNDAHPEMAPTFTVMTHNLWWRSQRRETARVPLAVSRGVTVQSAVSRVDGAPHAAPPADPARPPHADLPPASAHVGADIVAVQELMPHMAEMLHEELAAVYPHRLFDIGEAHDPPRRLGVLSRYPLDALDAAHLVARDFRVQIVRVYVPPRPILLYNIHPRATLIVRYLREEGPLARKVHRSFTERAVYFQRLVDDIARRCEPVIVVGDFNSTEQSDAYKLLARYLTDAHRAVGWGFGHTFPLHGADLGNLPIPTRLMRLDMIFYSAPLTALSCRVARHHGESDHAPVMATFG